MKSLHNASDLDQLGLTLLTGEADAYGMRILCDLNASGLALIQDFFGLPVMCQFEKNWNSKVNGEESVASIMLAHEILKPLVVFALLREGYQYVLQDEGWWYATAFNPDDLEDKPGFSHYLANPKRYGRRLFQNIKSRSPAPSVGSRNVHQFSGRAS